MDQGGENIPLPTRAPEQQTGAEFERHDPETYQPNPEIAPPQAERSGSVINKQNQASQNSPLVLPKVDPPQAATNVSQQAQISVTSPEVAADVEVIEKEWVDKAKKIVRDTREDPHEQGKMVGELKKDYKEKRYDQESPTQEMPRAA